MKKEPVIKVVKVEPWKAPKVVEIENKLEVMQEIVGGYIEFHDIDPSVSIVCNEEGKMIGLELNRGLYTPEGKLWEIIAGTFFIARTDFESGELVSLTDEDIARYMEQFKMAESFVRVGREIVAVKVHPMREGGEQ